MMSYSNENYGYLINNLICHSRVIVKIKTDCLEIKMEVKELENDLE